MSAIRLIASAACLTLLATSAFACGSSGSPCPDVAQLDEFWRILRAGPTPKASLDHVYARFGKTPIDFTGRLSNGRLTKVRISHLGFDDVEYYSHAPFLEVEVYVAEPDISSGRWRLLTVHVGPQGER